MILCEGQEGVYRRPSGSRRGEFTPVLPVMALLKDKLLEFTPGTPGEMVQYRE